MKDSMARLREAALQKEKERKSGGKPDAGQRDGGDIDLEVARWLGVTEAEVSSCCGSICSNCEMFLDKAIALVELGRPHHLFVNPSQEDVFLEALSVFRRDKKEYAARRQELMDRMRR